MADVEEQSFELFECVRNVKVTKEQDERYYRACKAVARMLKDSMERAALAKKDCGTAQ